MRSSIAIATLAASVSVVAASTARLEKIVKRYPATDIDAVVLNFALTLEHLEADFYAGGLAKYSIADFENEGYPNWVRERISEIASHEATHVDFLTTALTAAGASPVEACTYSFPDTDPKSFLAVAQVLEGVGVSAYLGAASLITSPDYLTAAGSILTVEARHNAWIRSAVNKGDGFPAPFDTPLSVNETFTLASAFITACPSGNTALPVVAFPTLTLNTAGKLYSGETISLTYDGSSSSSGAYVVFLTDAGQQVVPYPASGEIVIPDGIFGQLYAVISSSSGTLSESTVLAGPAIIDVDISPAYTFDA